MVFVKVDRLSGAKRPATPLTVVVRRLGVMLAIALIIGFAFLVLQSRFVWYDDEGFMLMTLHEYVSGYALYDAMYTEYGPFYYVVVGGLFSLAGVPVTHDSVRWLTLMCWITAAGGWAYSMWRWRKSLSLALSTFLFTTIVLRVVSNNPGHPQILIAVLPSAAITALSLVPAISKRTAFFIVGAAAGGLLLTKINVGIFFAVGLSVVWAAGRPLSHSRSLIVVTVAAASAVLPLVLMRHHLGSLPVLTEAVFFGFSLLLVSLYLFRRPRLIIGGKDVIWIVCGFLICCLLTIIIVRERGTSWAGLVSGVLLTPLRLSRTIQDPRPFPLAVSVMALAASAALMLLGRSRPTVLHAWRPLIGAGVVVLGVTSPFLFIALVPGLLWILVPEPNEAAVQSGRPISIALAAGAFNLLMVYPVPGDQLGVAASLLLAPAFAIVGETPSFFKTQRWFRRAGFLGVVLWLTGLLQAVRICRASLAGPTAEQHLPHSALIDLTPEEYDTYNRLLLALGAHCSTLATVPGMNSFHIWSGMPHPNGFIYSAAMPLFDETAQRKLLQSISSAPHLCVIYNPMLERWGERYREGRRERPFLDFVKNDLVMVFQVNNYQIRVPPSETPRWR